MKRPKRDQRALCRECGRGRFAPHRDGCTEGRERTSFYGTLARWAAEKDSRR